MAIFPILLIIDFSRRLFQKFHLQRHARLCSDLLENGVRGRRRGVALIHVDFHDDTPVETGTVVLLVLVRVIGMRGVGLKFDTF